MCASRTSKRRLTVFKGVGEEFPGCQHDRRGGPGAAVDTIEAEPGRALRRPLSAPVPLAV